MLNYNNASELNLAFSTAGRVTFAGGGGILGQTLTINGLAHTLIYTMAELDAIDSAGLGGAYALAGDLDAAGTTYTQALIGSDSSPFTGRFQGLGQEVSNLTINAGAASFIGLFGYISAGSVSDLGIVGGSITSTGTGVGALAGASDFSVITQSYATGAVHGGSSTGGLVGALTSGTITQSYATGAISGSSGVGGLVGYSSGSTLDQSCATGAVSGSSSVGGLVGNSFGGTITASYWDIQTSGTTTGVGTGSAGLTTAQFQSGTLPFGFDASVWSTGAGLYPYLTSFFPDGVQAVSGFAYKDTDTTLAASGAAGAVTVTLDADGGQIGQATTGANGYYYILTAAGTLADGTNLLVSTPANLATGATNAATLATSDGAATLANTNLYGYIAIGASFTIDQDLDLTASLPVRTSVGTPLVVSRAVTVRNGWSLALLSGGTLTINAPISARGAASIALGYDDASETNLAFGGNGRVTYLSTTGTAITSSAGGLLTLNGTSHTLIYTMAQLDAIDEADAVDGSGVTVYGPGLAGAYALANDLDAAGTTYTQALIGSSTATFTGRFQGIGQTIPT